MSVVLLLSCSLPVNNAFVNDFVPDKSLVNLISCFVVPSTLFKLTSSGPFVIFNFNFPATYVDVALVNSICDKSCTPERLSTNCAVADPSIYELCIICTCDEYKS